MCTYPHTENLLPVHVAARRLRRPARTIRYWISCGSLPASRMNRRAWGIRQVDLEQFRSRLEAKC